MKTTEENNLNYINAGNTLIGHVKSSNTECTVEKISRFTEQQFAEYFVTQFKEILRYDHDSDKWYIWGGSYWVKDKIKEINDYYNICLQLLLDDCKNQTDTELHKKYFKFLCDCEGYGKMRSILKLASSIEGIRITNNDLNNKINLYNCSNCTIDLSGKIPVRKDFNPNDNLTQITGVIYNPEAKAIEFIKFMNTIFDKDQELISYLQRVLGYCLTGYTNEDAVFFMYGTGKNGKSTFIEIMKMITGDYYERINMDSLIVKNNNSSINNDIACLKNARIVVASEIEAGKTLNESLLKDISGGDDIKARFLFKEYFTFTPRFKIWMAGNHKPVIKGTDNGIKRRLKLIPFTVRIPDEITISRSEILDLMSREASGILNWILEGFVEWRKEGLQEPLIVTTATDEYFGEMDSLKSFVEECCIENENINKENRTSVKEMFERYEKFCKKNKDNPMSKFLFDRKLKEKGHQTESGNRNITYWKSIAIK